MPEAVEEVARCLADETVAKRLAKSEGDVQLWRERAFDVVVDNEMISGVFDRVHVYADRAEVLDFKSDRVGDESSLQQAAKKYEPQMATYRQALAKLTGLKEFSIECSLVFTHPCRVIEV